jgi:hypothetical protein
MLAETTFARLGRDQSARALGGADPAGRRESVKQRMSEAPGDVVALFRPINAAAHRTVHGQHNPKLTQGAAARLGELVSDAVAEPTSEPAAVQLIELNAAVVAAETALIDQCSGDRDAEPPGDVVVAATGQADGVCPGTLPQRADGLRRCEPCDGLDELANLVPRQPVVAVPPGAEHLKHPSGAEFVQVRASGSGAHTRLASQHASGERAPIGECEQDLASAAVSQHGADHRQIRIPAASWDTGIRVVAQRHPPTLTPTRFDARRNVRHPSRGGRRWYMYQMVHKQPEEVGAIRGFRDKATAETTRGSAARARTTAGRER